MLFLFVIVVINNVFVVVDPRNFPLKFDEFDSLTAEILLTLSLCAWVSGGGGWGVGWCAK